MQFVQMKMEGIFIHYLENGSFRKLRKLKTRKKVGTKKFGKISTMIAVENYHFYDFLSV